MPSLLTPGVYIQEVALGPSPIQGVSTSVAGFVGEAERGLVSGSPSLVTSFTDFQRQFGNFVAGKNLAYAVQGFFDNGGQQAFITRVADASSSPASVTPQLGYDVAVLSFSTGSVAAGTPFTIRAATVVGVSEVGSNGAPTAIQLINRLGALVATLLVSSINTTAGTLVVTSNVALGPPSSTPSLSPASYALRYAGSNAQPPAVAPAIQFAFSARDPGSFGNNLRVLLTPTYLATAVISGVSAAPPNPAYTVNTIAPFEVGAQVELANAKSPSGRDIETISGIDAATNTITLGGSIAFASGDYIRALGWTLQVYYKGVLVETLTGITSNAGGSDGLSSINANSQWVRIPPVSPNVTYPSFDLNTVTAPAVAVGSVNLLTTAALYGAGGTLSGKTLVVDTPSSFTATFTPAPSNAADVLNAINSATGNSGTVIASLNGAGQLVLATLVTGTAAQLKIDASSTALVPLGIAAATHTGSAGAEPGPSVVTGTVDLTTLTYGAGGTLDGHSLQLQTDALPSPFTVTFTPTPSSDGDVVNAINNAPGNVGAVVASLNGSSELVLTSQTTGPTALITVVGGTPATIPAALGFTAGQTGSAGASGSAQTVWNPTGVSIAMAGGTDGNPVTASDVIGSDVPPRTGLKAIEAQDGISIIAAPGFGSGVPAPAGSNFDAVVAELIGQAERRQDRVAVFETVDGPTVDVNALLSERGKWNSQYAAMYAPWVTILDPLSSTNINVPPSGHVIGAYAATDNLRGVFKAPANVVLQNIVGFSRDIPTSEQDLLNPAGVNVLRNFPGLGNVIWGARTIAADPLWRYISVRRLFIFIEQSLVQGTRYAVFEPNDLRLWARLRDSVANFLTTQWQAGALFGATAQQAFFVRVDETTTTQDDRDNGIVNILVGIAPVKPAEFIVFQIGQAPESFIIAEQGS